MKITCKKCGSTLHNTLMCRKTPDFQAFSTETQECEEEENMDVYYAQLGLEAVSYTHLTLPTMIRV